MYCCLPVFPSLLVPVCPFGTRVTVIIIAQGAVADPLGKWAMRLRKEVFAALWKVPWGNARKEAYWLLALNGLKMPARLGGGHVCACGEGGAGSGRRHAYWECPVARAVREAVQSQLPASAGQLQLNVMEPVITFALFTSIATSSCPSAATMSSSPAPQRQFLASTR